MLFICERLIHAIQAHQAGWVTTPSPFLLLKNLQEACDMQGEAESNAAVYEWVRLGGGFRREFIVHWKWHKTHQRVFWVSGMKT